MKKMIFLSIFILMNFCLAFEPRNLSEKCHTEFNNAETNTAKLKVAESLCNQNSVACCDRLANLVGPNGVPTMIDLKKSLEAVKKGCDICLFGSCESKSDRETSAQLCLKLAHIYLGKKDGSHLSFTKHFANNFSDVDKGIEYYSETCNKFEEGCLVIPNLYLGKIEGLESYLDVDKALKFVDKVYTPEKAAKWKFEHYVEGKYKDIEKSKIYALKAIELTKQSSKGTFYRVYFDKYKEIGETDFMKKLAENGCNDGDYFMCEEFKRLNK